MPYHPRIAGTASKLRAFRDGLRILAMIVRQSFRLRPWRPLGVVGVGLLAVSTLVGSTPLLLVAGTILVAAVAPGVVVVVGSAIADLVRRTAPKTSAISGPYDFGSRSLTRARACSRCSQVTGFSR